ncbi:ecto-NOX disulfide-thiol exchanger 1 [Nephila pilipes]|uniref:Ecto-NOX disulfide-thiol exchanger 1 n=1 Tax=Nephila pilipes TaxID=299642 RepID=A0A8X6QIW0_NEPPI|nr:ecto-NOX disulfide-thiol exchanger 1 [Nephila pilipes]
MDGMNNSANISKFRYFSENLSSRSELSVSKNNDKSCPRERNKRSLSPENWLSKLSKKKDTSRIHNLKNDIKVGNVLDGNQPLDDGVPSQERTATIPSKQPIVPQRPIYKSSYPPYRYSAQENYMEHNRGNYAMMSPYNKLPMCSQRPIINESTIPASSIEISSNISANSISKGLGMNINASSTMVSNPYMSMANDSHFYGMVSSEENYFPLQRMTYNNIPKTIPNTPIVLSNSVLIPPLPEEIKTRCEKPEGLQTVYVRNLPEKYNAKIHVDYATTHDDQMDFEGRKRQKEREERHLVKSSCPPYYTDHEAVLLIDKLRNDETFNEAIQILICWLEKGVCCKRNIGTFFSMLHCANCHAVRLVNKKAELDEEVKKARENLDTMSIDLQFQLSKIEKAYIAAEKQKNWDHFTKKQRKNIEDWKKSVKIFSDDLISTRVEVDMDLDESNEKLWISREEYDELRQRLTSIERKLEESNTICSEYYKENLKLKFALEENRRESNIFGVAAKARFR